MQTFLAVFDHYTLADLIGGRRGFAIAKLLELSVTGIGEPENVASA